MSQNEDWYTSPYTGTHNLDFDSDPNRCLSLMLLKEGDVAFALKIGDVVESGRGLEDVEKAIEKWVLARHVENT